jgi:Flp pilus assembly protein TadB
MSKERARRREARLAVLEKEKAARARTVARRQRRRAVLSRLRLRRRSSGQLYRRSRGERLGILLVPAVAVAAVWMFVPELSLRIVLTAVLVLAAPALVVVVLGRKAG